MPFDFSQRFWGAGIAMRGRKRRSVRFRKAAALLTAACFLAGSPGAAGGPAVYGLAGGNRGGGAPPVDVTPQVNKIVTGVSGLERPAANGLVVRQDKPKAVIDWASFDIGRDAWTHFDQQGRSDWTALNRIYDRNPSLIFGRLTADGKVFLINQNGILFGPEARVNVQALTASALNIRDEDFLAGRLSFKAENYIDPGLSAPAQARVANDGAIAAAPLGQVVLLAPVVENCGAVAAPAGQIGLIAASEAELASNASRGLDVRHAAAPEVPAIAANQEGGRLDAEGGWIGMFGRAVNQGGHARAVTALKQNGQIVLSAREKVTTGARSVTESPITESGETAHESFEFSGGRVLLQAEGIEHRGLIQANSGEVRLEAARRVYLESGSRIDVKGSAASLPASANQVKVQLNSVELKDDFGQKNGLLKGRQIEVNALQGSSIGDIAGALGAREKTALERSIRGGTVSLSAPEGDVVVRQGAVVDFSGGERRFEAGFVRSSKLVSGTQVFDISDSPQWRRYDALLSDFAKVNRRFGMRREYRGSFLGGAEPLAEHMPAYTEGADAGRLAIAARQVVLDGTLAGGAASGGFQLETGAAAALPGRAAPRGGSLTIGIAPTGSPQQIDLAVQAIEIAAETPALPADFAFDSPLPGAGAAPPLTTLGAARLNAAGLSDINLFANVGIRIAPSAEIRLAPGGVFNAGSRSIRHEGQVRVPGGAVILTIDDNATSYERLLEAPNPKFQPAMERIWLGAASRIDAAGERVDLTRGGGPPGGPPARINGGAIVIEDRIDALTGSLLVREGAALDVSGGYRMDAGGKVAAGDAGSIRLQGHTLVLDGRLSGFSLAGKSGGALTVHAGELAVVQEAAPLPEDFRFDTPLKGARAGRLALSAPALEASGFSRLDLRSIHDLTVEPSVSLAPSLLKTAPPVPAGPPGPDGAPPVSPPATHREKGALALTAGQLFFGLDPNTPPDLEARLHLAPGARLGVPAEGRIALKAPALLLEGGIEAPAGSVTAAATVHDLHLAGGARLSAAGVNRPAAAAPSGAAGAGLEPLSAGAVSLKSTGRLIVEAGAEIDVSGPAPIAATVRRPDGTLAAERTAGSGGDLTLEHGGGLWLAGGVRAGAALAGIPSGGLELISNSETAALTLTGAELERFRGLGFDALTLKSRRAIEFLEGADVAFGRRVTLDAPQIVGHGSVQVGLSAPWIEVLNSRETYAAPSTAAPATRAALSLSGGAIDVAGSVSLAGFASVAMRSAGDIRLADREYQEGSRQRWEGALRVPGDLTLEAAYIYPTTQSRFSIASPGRIALSAAPLSGKRLLPSADGELEIEARTIAHGGRLAAPLGRITLRGRGEDSRVYLAEASETIAGGEGSVRLGALTDSFWTAIDKTTNLAVEVEQAPEKRIAITGGEVIIRGGARIDAAGGGEVFAYQWLPGAEGSTNPLARPQRFVIMPDRSIAAPGEALYLEGGAGLASGSYAVLPMELAFTPGALVVERLGPAGIGAPAASAEGFTVLSGCQLAGGSAVRSPATELYAVRPAREVLAEGYFNVRRFAAEEGGHVTVAGRTTIVEGAISGRSGREPDGGSLTLVAGTVAVSPAGGSLAPGFGAESELPAELRGKLLLQDAALRESPFSRISIGEAGTTDAIVVRRGSRIDAGSIRLSADREILFEAETGVRVSQGIELFAPAGEVRLAAGSVFESAGAVAVEARSLELGGDFSAIRGEVRLAGDRIVLGGDGGAAAGAFHVPLALWSRFEGAERLTLVGRSGVTVDGAARLSAGGALTIDTPRLAAGGGLGDGEAVVAAARLTLMNSGEAPPPDAAAAGGARLVLKAADASVGRGAIRLDGFRRVEIHTENDLVLVGGGALETQGDLALHAARLTQQGGRDDAGAYARPHFRIAAPQGRITLSAAGGAPGGDLAAGGELQIAARSIEQRGILEVFGGRIELAASGSGPEEGIFLREGSVIRVAGNDLLPGGLIALRAPGGALELAGGALLDVAAGAQGDAGALVLHAPRAEPRLDGRLQGAAPGAGRGGAFDLDSRRIAELGPLAAKLEAAGFTGELSLRSREGDVSIGSGTRIRASGLRLTADGGGIDVGGTIDVSGPAGGGSIELTAAQGIRLGSGGRLLARAEGGAASAAGGRVELSSGAGGVAVSSGAVIDLAPAGSGRGGQLTLRAPRQGADVPVELAGGVGGASEVVVEAVRAHDAPQEALDEAQLQAWIEEAADFMARADAIRGRIRLAAGLDPAVDLHLVPGIEVRADGNLRLAAAIDLTARRFGAEPGALTLRAAGSLRIDHDIVDSPNAGVALAQSTPRRDSWAISLVAGADLASADPMAVAAAEGELRVAGGARLYTESAPLRFASAKATVLEGGDLGGPETKVRLATYDGAIRGRTGGDLELSGAVIQSAAGLIELDVKGDLALKSVMGFGGSVRTTGRPQFHGAPPEFADELAPEDYLSFFWNYAGGGDIRIAAAGEVAGALSSRSAWDSGYALDRHVFWGPSHGSGGLSASFPTEGIAAMGGGSVRVSAGGAVRAQIGAFGAGDLSVISGGDIDGRFLARAGRATILAGGSFGRGIADNAIEIFDAAASVTALGDLALGSAVNPTIAGRDFLSGWDLTYATASSLALRAVHGDATLSGRSRFHPADSPRSRILPPRVTIEAGRDIRLSNSFALAPSPQGGLRLAAGRDIDGMHLVPGGGGLQPARAAINLSGADVRAVYGNHTGEVDRQGMIVQHAQILFNNFEQAEVPLHLASGARAAVRAGRDLKSLSLALPMPADFEAGRDIRDVYLLGQNLRPEDATRVRAGREIRFQALAGAIKGGIEWGGPGFLSIQAGRGVDLGTTQGIQSVGNQYNTALGLKGCDIGLVVGYDADLSAERMRQFFDAIRDLGVRYSRHLAEGDFAAAAERIEEIRQQVAAPTLGPPAATGGDLDMVSSQINSSGGPDSLSVIAAGSINVGRSTFFTDESVRRRTGIFTAAGGDINLFSRGDLNVNESRVMTFRGGNITAFCDQGSINAGRGSKTAINTEPPKRVPFQDTYIVVFEPPAVGSGIRTLTYDPDGATGPAAAPPAGDVYLFAPQGTIDAGEAGIAGRNVILGATEVLNAQNISFALGSVGVPQTGPAGPSMGALAGAGSVSEATKMASESATVRGAEERLAKYTEELNKSLVPKIILVEVLGFEEEEKRQ